MDVRYNVATCNGAKNFYKKKKIQGNSANHFTNVHTYLLILFGVVNYNVFKKPRLNTFIWAKCTIVHIICLSSGSRLARIVARSRNISTGYFVCWSSLEPREENLSSCYVWRPVMALWAGIATQHDIIIITSLVMLTATSENCDKITKTFFFHVFIKI